MIMFWSLSICLLLLYLVEEILSVRTVTLYYNNTQKELERQESILSEQEGNLRSEIGRTESVLSERFLFYDTARKIAPFLNRQHLLTTFSQEIRYLGSIDDISFGGQPQSPQYKSFKFGKGAGDVLHIKTESQAVLEYLPYFLKLLELCSERIKLYNRLQELSIFDSLTQIYNRRYFMTRYLEEFERAKRLGLSVSFLMVDIDHFKEINDTYGHLVGDVVLRNLAKLIRKNLREMDFIARYGGEEFSIILPETDKAGAIMVAERISSRVSRERIRAFDETLSATLSIGVATFPQNTLHSDVLIEIADKALYKAKISGRNRVCWF